MIGERSAPSARRHRFDTMLTLWRRLDDVPPNARLPWAVQEATGAASSPDLALSRRFRLSTATFGMLSTESRAIDAH
ncbi:MAG: hypothetical protein WD532_04485 [Acidimicrobiia bacterium]